MNSVRILAVDDDPNHLAAVKRILRRSRFDVTTCANPKLGLQLAVTDPPDLILLDVSMPCMSGQEFLRRLRRAEVVLDQECETPVIFLSGLAASHQRVSGLDAGAVDYITKPFDPEELRARIRNRLRHPSACHDGLSLKAGRRETDMPVATDGPRSAPEGVCEALQDFESPLIDLNAVLELARLVRQPALQEKLLLQARKDVNKLAHSFSQIAALHDAQRRTCGQCDVSASGQERVSPKKSTRFFSNTEGN